jgi:hydroxyacylglutathione hydrolase
MQVQRIPAGIYQANCYLVMDDTTREAVLIDPAGDAPFLLKKIREQEADVKAILLTHGHGDHIGAAQELKDTLSVPILAHKDEVELLKDPNLNLSKSMFHGPYSIRPDQVFSEETLPYLSGIQVIHTPGHTEGSVCFIIEQAMLSGDTLFFGIDRTNRFGHIRPDKNADKPGTLKNTGSYAIGISRTRCANDYGAGVTAQSFPTLMCLHVKCNRCTIVK